MNCQRTKERLGPYLDGELSGALERATEAHVDECPACRRELERLRAITSALSEPVTADVPRNLWPAIERRLHDTEAAPDPPERKRVRLQGATLAAATLVGAVGLGLFALTWSGADSVRAEAATVNFGMLLDALPLDADKAFRKFLLLYQGRPIAPFQAQRFAPDLNFALPESLPGGFQLDSAYSLRFGSDAGIAARYARNGEILIAVFHPRIDGEDFGTHRDYPCLIGRHRGHKVQVGGWKLVHLTDPTTCHCVLSRLDETSELPAIMAAVSPQPTSPDSASPFNRPRS